MKTQTIHYLKQHADNLSLEDGPLTIIQDGIPLYRIYSEQQAQQIDEVIALLKLTHLAERDISENEVMTPEDALNRLKHL
ncbi:hypothetical protein VQ7734_02321 [Vibrio quintilis]|uniref:Phd_YefM n=2 Tax=Vibrio quintilis TaxID=1117707 RepID=A0A1M7YVA7_9VIBR|nr:hypothetical protein VQ7734_02321 [Vibrio quintilis]